MYTSTPSWICLDCWTVWPRLSRYLLIIAPRHITWPLSTLGHWIHGPFEVIPERTGINLQMARSPARLIPLLQLSPYRPKLSITSLPLDSNCNTILNRGNRATRRVATGHDYAIKFTTDIKLEIQDGEKNPGTQHPNKKH